MGDLSQDTITSQETEIEDCSLNTPHVVAEESLNQDLGPYPTYLQSAF